MHKRALWRHVRCYIIANVPVEAKLDDIERIRRSDIPSATDLLCPVGGQIGSSTTNLGPVPTAQRSRVVVVFVPRLCDQLRQIKAQPVQVAAKH